MKKQSNLLFLLLFIFALLPARQVNAQQKAADSLFTAQPGSTLPVSKDSVINRPSVLPDSLSYRFMGDGNFSRGNVHRSLIVVRAEIMLMGPVLSLATNPRYTYGEQNRQLAEQETYIDLFIDLYKEKRLYVFGLGTIERSNLRQINWRQLAGLGLGLRLAQNSQHALSITNAVIHESTDFRQRPTISIQRNSTRLKGRHSFLEDKILFTHVTFVQPALADFANLRWNTHVSLALPLTNWLAIQSSFDHSYESVVEATRKRADSRLTFGISVGNRPR